MLSDRTCLLAWLLCVTVADDGWGTGQTYRGQQHGEVSCAFMSSLKDQGNAEFASEQYLKAAATYTKAIKQDPENAVLYR